MGDDLTEAIHSLERRRGDHLRQVELIEQAIMSLRAIMQGEVSGQRQPERPLPAAPPGQERPSVYRTALAIIGETDREWSIEELRAEIETRDIPIEVTDLQNSLFSALSRAARKGELVRSGPGRYRSAKFGGLSLDMRTQLRPAADVPFLNSEPAEEAAAG